jgi:ADP-ribosylglycohydrolase
MKDDMSLESIPRREQFSGCLVGQCLGDALGFVVEGFSPAACERYVEDYLRTERAGDFGQWPFPFGQYSDDSQLSRELIQSYVECRKFDPADYAEHLKLIFAEERIVAFGYSTKESVKRLIQGISWEESGALPPAAGNGSAMRAAPIGLFFFDDPEMLIKAAHDQGRITHRDPRCSAGAVAISGAVALALQKKDVNPHSFLPPLIEWTGSIEPVLSSELKNLTEWISMPPEKAATFISKAGVDPDYIDEEGHRGITPYVVGSVLWSLYSFLRTPDDYWETICTAIVPGGDVDTTAAMAGAISGAYLGLDAIPKRLAYYLRDRETWKFDDLVELANKCYDIKMQISE